LKAQTAPRGGLDDVAQVFYAALDGPAKIGIKAIPYLKAVVYGLAEGHQR
jgi:hypothetical protein